MANICICSEITCDYISTNIEDFPLLNETFDLDVLIRENWIVIFNDVRIVELVEFLSASIDKLLVNKDFKVSSTMVEFKRNTVVKVMYKHVALKFDLRDKYDSHVYQMITLYDYCNRAILYNGNLYFYNRNKIEEIEGFDVIALLRVKYSLTKGKLIDELSKIINSSRFFKIKENIDFIIENLESLGVLNWNSLDNHLTLTPRGYMLH
jgi:hypothetical protein